jgi:hypothetical protein
LFAPEAVARSVEEKYGLPLAKIERWCPRVCGA